MAGHGSDPGGGMELQTAVNSSQIVVGNAFPAANNDMLSAGALGKALPKSSEEDADIKPATASRESSVVERASASRSPPECRSRQLASEWDISEVQRYLKSIGLEELQETFREHQVTGLVLLSLTEEDLHRSLGIQKFGPRRRLIIGLAELREEEIAASTAKTHCFPYGPDLLHRPTWSTTTTGTTGTGTTGTTGTTSGSRHEESDSSILAPGGGHGLTHGSGSLSIVGSANGGGSPTMTPTPGGATPLPPDSPRSTGTCSPLPRSDRPSDNAVADAARSEWTGLEVSSQQSPSLSSVPAVASGPSGGQSWSASSHSPPRGRGVRPRSPTPSMSPSWRSSLNAPSFSKRQLMASPPRRPTPTSAHAGSPGHGSTSAPDSGAAGCGSLTAPPAGQPRLSPARAGRHPGVSGHFHRDFGSPSSGGSPGGGISEMPPSTRNVGGSSPGRNGPLSRPSSSRATSPPGATQRDRLVSGQFTHPSRTTPNRGAAKTPKKGSGSSTVGTPSSTPLGTPAQTPANTPSVTPTGFNSGTPPPTSFTAPAASVTVPVSSSPPMVAPDATLGRPQSASVPTGCSPMSWFENVREAPSMASPPPRTGSPTNASQPQLRTTPRHTPSSSPSPGSVVQAALAHVHAVLSSDAPADTGADEGRLNEAQDSGVPEQEHQEMPIMPESESEVSEARGTAGVMAWPMTAWGEIQAAQHRHTRAWVVARALTTANGLPQAMAREAAQLRTMARDIDVQILLPAASAVSGGARGSVMDTSSASSASSFAARRPFVHLYTERLLGDVLEDLACRASARSTQAEAAARACIGRLEEALLNRLSSGIEGRRPRSSSGTGLVAPKQSAATTASPMSMRRDSTAPRDGRGSNHTPSQAGKGLRTGSPNSGSNPRFAMGHPGHPGVHSSSGTSTLAASNAARPPSPANLGGSHAALPEGTATGGRPLCLGQPGFWAATVTTHASPARGTASPMRPMAATSMAFVSASPSK